MLGRRHLASCLLLSVVALGFLAAEANAESTQAAILFPYEGYVRLTMGRFSGAVQPAIVWLELTTSGNAIYFETHGYWNFNFECDAIVIWGGDDSVSASCSGPGAYVKFWTRGLYPYPYLYATLQFYIPYVRGQFSGVPTDHATP